MGTWADARDWATTVAVVLGLPAAVYQLLLQRRQFAGEVTRNVRRDELIDSQLRDLDQRERLRNREQAEGVDLHWSGEGDQASMARVTNSSRRPIRDVVSQLDPGRGKPRCRPVGQDLKLEQEAFPRDPGFLHGVTDGWRVANIRSRETFVFEYDVWRAAALTAPGCIGDRRTELYGLCLTLLCAPLRGQRSYSAALSAGCQH